MKVLLLLLSLPSLAQDPYIARWNNTAGIVYEVQQSPDNVSWKTLGDTSSAVGDSLGYTLPLVTAYYRVTAGSVSSKALYMKVYNTFITSPVYKSTTLTWSTSGEQNVSYYLIEKTFGSKTTKVTSVMAKGSSKYTYRLSRTVNKYSYKITPMYKDGTKGSVINFK